jgi:alkanesulfonate monooxygenase SsuD/methylene tetrahydromethanopterin reductase-like flavin-dependent oxidoreductase (luciferase family)
LIQEGRDGIVARVAVQEGARRMKFSLTITFSKLEEYIPLAVAVEECGWNSVNVGDGLFYFDETSVDYPYSDSGERYWTGETHFPDPFSICAAMAVATKRVKLFINVLKLPVRDPMLVAKAAATVAALSNDRLVLGVGTSPWPEDYKICRQQWEMRGPRCAEMIHVLRKAFTGQMFDHHGKFYDIPRLQISPVGSKPVPILIGGTVRSVLKRAARIADGFASPNTTADKIGDMIREINGYRKEFGTDKKPFEMVSVAIDTWNLDGHRRLADMGVTEACTVPWFFYGGNFESPLDFKIDSIKRFTDAVVSKMRN